MSDSPERIWIWFAENGNIRKWHSSAFDEGTAFVRADLYDELVDDLQELLKRAEHMQKAENERGALAADKAELLAALEQLRDEQPTSKIAVVTAELRVENIKSRNFLARHAAPAKEEG